MWIGVSPLTFLWLVIAPWCTRNIAAASFDSRAARCKKELPVRVSMASGFEPLSMRRAAKMWLYSLVSSQVRYDDSSCCSANHRAEAPLLLRRSRFRLQGERDD